MFHVITQGYTGTAILLFFLYCFHAGLRSYYYSLAKIANILIWLLSLFLLLFVLYVHIAWTSLFGASPWAFIFGSDIPMVTWFFSAFGIILIALLFKKVRNQAVWILLPIAWMVNPGIMTGDFIDEDDYSISWLNHLPVWQRFVLFTFIFFLFIVMIKQLVKKTRENLAKETTRLPDRI